MSTASTKLRMLSAHTAREVVVRRHRDDLGAEAYSRAMRSDLLAWDIETSGLDWRHDRIGTCQILFASNEVHIVHIGSHPPARLCQILASERITKVFHHAVFDLRFMRYAWGADIANTRCTKIAARIVSPNAEEVSLQSLVQHYLGVTLKKGLAASDWLKPDLTQPQLRYAAEDVLYLPPLIGALEAQLDQRGLMDLAKSAWDFLPTRVQLDLLGAGDVYRY